MTDNLIDEFKPEIREALFDVAEEVLQTKDCKIRIEPGSKKGNNLSIRFSSRILQIHSFSGDNFLGIVYRATCSTEDESNAINLFVKMAPEDETKRQLMRIHDCFLRESYVYKVVTIEIQKQMKCKNSVVKGSERSSIDRRCYHFFESSKSPEMLYGMDLIIMPNATKRSIRNQLKACSSK